ncbi:MAG: hypothetical protein ACLGRW_12500 [Acidobacteriota bacterium]
MAAGPSGQAQTRQTPTTPTKAVPTARMYWHFFSYQHYLDTLAAKYEAAGKDAAGLRNTLQKQLNFSDTEFAPVRTSCDQLAVAVQELSSEVKANHSGIAAFDEARDQEVQTEINTLTNRLSPANKAALDALVVRLFTPRQPAEKGVQQ